jgi:hypothetical protein
MEIMTTFPKISWVNFALNQTMASMLGWSINGHPILRCLIREKHWIRSPLSREVAGSRDMMTDCQIVRTASPDGPWTLQWLEGSTNRECDSNEGVRRSWCHSHLLGSHSWQGSAVSKPFLSIWFSPRSPFSEQYRESINEEKVDGAVQSLAATFRSSAKPTCNQPSC